jgi:hypothetical protein
MQLIQPPKSNIDLLLVTIDNRSLLDKVLCRNKDLKYQAESSGRNTFN